MWMEPPPPLGGGGNSVAALTSPWHASHYCPPLTSQRGVMGDGDGVW